MKATINFKGGSGSGHHGHSGRPGKLGGSSPGGGQASTVGAGPNPVSPSSIRSIGKTAADMEDWGTPIIRVVKYGTMSRPNAVKIEYAGEGPGVKTRVVSVGSLMNTSDGETIVKWDEIL